MFSEITNASIEKKLCLKDGKTSNNQYLKKKRDLVRIEMSRTANLDEILLGIAVT